ncbi:MFS transporter [Myxococcota bacterium]|nr:MFS transporter [Myxococcota bacterium]MBU1430479.1 MFS transporter [Myxococcota bacterium]MBU1900065.1 MFS transporter [Myxococcota bacterium]
MTPHLASLVGLLGLLGLGAFAYALRRFAGSFRALVGAQFFGAFNDNLFKQLLLFLAAKVLFPGKDVQGLAFAIFALPFVLFSGIAGDLSERLSKRDVIVWMKWLEILVMLLGALSFYLMSWPMMLAVLFLMGAQSAFFGPSKYGVIPELVPPARLVSANGAVAMTTFMAVLLGQALAGPLLDKFSARLWLPGLVCAGFALLGTGIALWMKPLSPLKPDLRLSRSPFGRLFGTIKILRQQKGLFRIVVLHSFFWFNGGVLQQAIVAFGEPNLLNVGNNENVLLSYLMVTLAISIMAGSALTPLIARRVAPGRLVMGGAMVMALAQLSLLALGPIFSRGAGGFLFTHAALAVVGLAGAAFVVPVQSFLQDGPEAGMRGQTFAVNNFMNFLFIFIGGVFYLGARNALSLSPTLTQALAGVAMIAFLIYARQAVARMRIGEAA